MKKIITILLISLMGTFAYAQNRLPEIKRDHSQESYNHYDNGFWCAVEANAGSSLRFSHSNSAIVGANAIAGYRYNQFFKVGFGMGLRYYCNNENFRERNMKWSFPIFLNARGNFIPQDYRTVVPFYNISVGGAIQDGLMIQPGIGLKIGEERSAFTITLSYLGQQMDLVGFGSEFTSFINLSLGYEF